MTTLPTLGDDPACAEPAIYALGETEKSITSPLEILRERMKNLADAVPEETASEEAAA